MRRTTRGGRNVKEFVCEMVWEMVWEQSSSEEDYQRGKECEGARM